LKKRQTTLRAKIFENWKKKLKNKKKFNKIIAIFEQTHKNKQITKIFEKWCILRKKMAFRRNFFMNSLNPLIYYHKRMAFEGLNSLILNNESIKIIEKTQNKIVNVKKLFN